GSLLSVPVSLHDALPIYAGGLVSTSAAGRPLPGHLVHRSVRVAGHRRGMGGARRRVHLRAGGGGDVPAPSAPQGGGTPSCRLLEVVAESSGSRPTLGSRRCRRSDSPPST